MNVLIATHHILSVFAVNRIRQDMELPIVRQTASTKSRPKIVLAWRYGAALPLRLIHRLELSFHLVE